MKVILIPDAEPHLEVEVVAAPVVGDKMRVSLGNEERTYEVERRTHMVEFDKEREKPLANPMLLVGVRAIR